MTNFVAAVGTSARSSAALVGKPPAADAVVPAYDSDVADAVMLHASQSQSVWRTFSYGIAAGAIAAVAQCGYHRATRRSNRVQRSALSSLVSEPLTTIALPELKTVEEVQHKRAEHYTLMLYNDPLSKREFVARCLMIICLLPDRDAFHTMMKAHKDGLAIVGVFPFETAEMYMEGLKAKGLRVDIIPVESDDV